VQVCSVLVGEQLQLGVEEGAGEIHDDSCVRRSLSVLLLPSLRPLITQSYNQSINQSIY
jgi:hypothetical protein